MRTLLASHLVWAEWSREDEQTGWAAAISALLTPISPDHHFQTSLFPALGHPTILHFLSLNDLQASNMLRFRLSPPSSSLITVSSRWDRQS